MPNFADLVDLSAARTPHHTAVRQDGAALTFSELSREARRLAGALGDRGIQRGDRVAVLMHNSVENLLISIGSVGLGAVLVPVNTRLAPAEVAFVLNHCEARVLFVGKEFRELIAGIRPQLDALEQVVVTEGGTSELFIAYDDFLAGASPAAEWADLAPDDDCAIVYTSGTTGYPKGVVRSHSSALWSASTFAGALGTDVRASDSYLYCIPLASIGLLNIIGSCLFTGLTIELMYRFDVDEALAFLVNGATHTYFVPSMWRMIVNAADRDNLRPFSLRFGMWGGERLDPSLRDQIVERFGPILVGAFGATEGGIVTGRPGDDVTHPATSGRASGYNITTVVNDQGGEAEPDEVGELVTRSPTLMTRYFRDPVATDKVLRDGRYHSGDLGYKTVDGFIYIVDRKKDMLISGGQNVYPAEIERVLASHPSVAVAAVVGQPDATWGEVGHAFVVLKPQAHGDPADLSNYVRSQLASYKIPAAWTFVDGLPTNANGKVRKHALRAQLGT